MHTPQVEPERNEPLAHIEVALGDERRAVFRTAQARQLGRDVARLGDEQFAAHVEKAPLAPDGRRNLLGDADPQAARPAAGNHRLVDPWKGDDALLNTLEVGAHETALELAGDRLLDLQRRHALERAADLDRANRPVEHAGAGQVGRNHDADRDQGRHHVRDVYPWQAEAPHLLFLLLASGLSTRHWRPPPTGRIQWLR